MYVIMAFHGEAGPTSDTSRTRSRPSSQSRNPFGEGGEPTQQNLYDLSEWSPGSQNKQSSGQMASTEERLIAMLDRERHLNQEISRRRRGREKASRTDDRIG